MYTIQISSRFCWTAHLVSMLFSGLAVLASGTALFGWMLGSGRLIRLGLADEGAAFALAADAAMALLLAGMVLLLHQDIASSRLVRYSASACALGVIVFAGSSLGDRLFSTGFGLGGLFATDAFGETAGMSLSEAVALLLLGFALLWRDDVVFRRFRPSEWLAVLVALQSLVSILTVLCGIHWPAVPGAVLVVMSPVFMLLFLLLPVALLLARPGRRLFAILPASGSVSKTQEAPHG